MTPTILISTMYCGEPDFQHCVAALKAQKGVNIKHHVISFKPELEAHNEVYQTFNEADPTWFRAKIDADVVLLNDGILLELVEFWRVHSHVQWLDPAVHDHLTESIIHAGIAFYTPSVRFNTQTDPLKCDRGVLQKDYMMLDYNQPVANHMLYADEKTAFRFGLHRGLKGQTHVEHAVRKAYAKHQDPIRAMALKGFDAARSERYLSWHLGVDKNVPSDHNYTDDNFMKLWQKSK